MPTDLAFGTGAGDYRQLRFGGAASLIPLQGFSAVASGTVAVANTAQAVFAVGLTTSETGEPFAGAPAHLTFAGAPTTAAQLRFNGTASLLSFAGIDNPATGKGSITNAAWAVWMVGHDAAAVGSPVKGPVPDLNLVAPAPVGANLTFGGAATLLPVPSIELAQAGVPTIHNTAHGVLCVGLDGAIAGSPFVGVPTNLVLQDALPVGQPLDLYFNYGDALRPAGVPSLTFGVPDVASTGRAVYPVGVDAFAHGVWEEGTRALPVPSVGMLSAMGTPVVDTWLKYTTPAGTSAAGYGVAKVYGTTLTVAGLHSLTFGNNAIQLRTLFPAGFSAASAGVPSAHNRYTYATFVGFDAAVAPLFAVERGVRQLPLSGFDQLEFTTGRPIVDNIGTRQYSFPSIPPAGGYGVAYVGNYTRYLQPAGVQAAAYGAFSAALLHRSTHPGGFNALQLGTPNLVLFNTYLPVDSIGDTTAFTPAAVTREIQDALVVGSALTGYGSAQLLLRNRAVQFAGDSYFAADFSTVQLWQRQVKPVGADLLRSDDYEVANINRSLGLAGHLSETLGALTVGNQSQGVFVLGAETDEYGTAWVDRAQRSVQVIGVDAAEHVKPWVDRGARPGQVVGLDATTYGTPELYNNLQFVLAAGAAGTGYGTPAVSDTTTTVQFIGAHTASAGALTVRYGSIGPTGLDAPHTPLPFVSRAVRSVTVRPADDISWFGHFTLQNRNWTVQAHGAPPPAWYGDLLVRDRTSKVFHPGVDCTEIGTFALIGPRWVYQNEQAPDGDVGKPLSYISDEGTVRAYGVTPRNRYGLAYVYNNARVVAPEAWDSQFLPRVLDVAGTQKWVHVAQYEEPYASNYMVAYNAAWGVYPSGRDMAAYGTGLDTANLNRTSQALSVPPEPLGDPWVSHAVRSVYHEDNTTPQLPPAPVVELWQREVRPAGLWAYGDAAAYVFEHFTIIKPRPVAPPHINMPTLRKLTPEVLAHGAVPDAYGTPTVYNQLQHVRPVGLDSVQSLRATATHWRRTVYPVGESMRVLGNPAVQEDLLAWPVTRTITIKEYEYADSAYIGDPTARLNVIYAGGLAPSNRFGNFTTRDQSITFDSSAPVVDGGTIPILPPAIPAPRVLLAYTQYAYMLEDDGTAPPQIYMKRHRVTPDYVFADRPNPNVNIPFWATPTETADNQEFGVYAVDHTLRTRVMTGTAMQALGIPGVTERGPRRVEFSGLDPTYYGWLEVSGGVRRVDTFDEGASTEYSAMGVPAVGRPPDPPSPFLYPEGLHSLQSSQFYADNYHRSRVIGGTDMQQLPKFVVTPPFFVTPVDTDLAKYGTAYADHRIRTIMHNGGDMFLAEPDFYGGDETTVRTPAPPAPAQYIYAKGRKPAECCWGFYIGRST